MFFELSNVIIREGTFIVIKGTPEAQGSLDFNLDALEPQRCVTLKSLLKVCPLPQGLRRFEVRVRKVQLFFLFFFYFSF